MLTNRIVLYTLFFMLTLSSLGYAKTGTAAYSFESSARQKQFEALTEQLRCLVCQNESLWDSSAPLAKDLRTEIYHQVKSGQSETAIKQYLVERYGQFILFKPMLNSTTYVLWIIPFVLLIFAFLIAGWVILRSRRFNKI